MKGNAKCSAGQTAGSLFQGWMGASLFFPWSSTSPHPIPQVQQADLTDFEHFYWEPAL